MYSLVPIYKKLTTYVMFVDNVLVELNVLGTVVFIIITMITKNNIISKKNNNICTLS